MDDGNTGCFAPGVPCAFVRGTNLYLTGDVTFDGFPSVTGASTELVTVSGKLRDVTNGVAIALFASGFEPSVVLVLSTVDLSGTMDHVTLFFDFFFERLFRFVDKISVLRRFDLKGFNDLLWSMVVFSVVSAGTLSTCDVSLLS